MAKISKKRNLIVFLIIILLTLIIFSLILVKTKPNDPCEDIVGYEMSGDVAISKKDICYGNKLQDGEIKDVRLCKPICEQFEVPFEKDKCEQKCILIIENKTKS